ncbi:phosphate regulon sensor histidine kinase PhoR [Ignatzschineria larvae DSM 13226]|uniref:Phosphate regulon sensor protein PhoR n=1 Tax=Ignatzschineria larvae DSM 13226 TaxID=1111732 RepID=A0ABZ3BX36_9GAMM|nr:phosphate regulon sensor histidine kinase PhoR [Ignatzschineria larvae]
MLGHISIKHFIVELLLAALPAILLSFIVGHLFLWLFLETLFLLIWHYRQAYRLSHWIWVDHNIYPPEGRGVWLRIFHGLRRMRLDQRKERNQLLEFIKYFRKGAESMPDATILCDKDGRLNWCNPQAEAMLKLRWPQDEGQNIFNLIRKPDIVEYFKKGDFDQPFLLKHDQRELECRFYYPYIENNLLIIARDITDREIAERTRQMFFANVNHELRVPLTVLRGYVEMLENNLSDEEKESFEGKALLRMEEQIERLHALVIQLMALTRLETAPKEDQFTTFNFSALLTSIIEDYQQNHPETRAYITSDIAPNIEIWGNSEQLRQVVSNLFYNAIEHNPSETPIHLSLKQQNNRVEFTIEDQGAGIPAIHLHKLTERFYRVDSSRNRNQSGGSGLGLAIVKHALNNHNSQLQVSSEVGKGSKFGFVLIGV